MTWALDLDGVVWLAGRGIAGSAGAVEQLRASGQRVVFLTNNSGPTVAAHVAALGAVGIECDPADLATSAQAAASLLEPGCRAAVIGDEGAHEALRARGVVVVGPLDGPDAVVVGRMVELDYWTLAAAATAVREGARFIATNTDATFPAGNSGGPRSTPSGPGPSAPSAGGRQGLLPGAGALVAFVATASRHQPEVAGKPHGPMVALVRARYGALSMVAGDRPDTDGLFAKQVGARFGLVLSGVTRRSDLPVSPAPDLVGDNLAALVTEYLRSAAQPSC